MRSLCRSYECMNIVRVNIGFFTGFKKIKQWRILKTHGTNQIIGGFYTKTTQNGGFSKLWVKTKTYFIPTYSIYQHVSIIQYLFSAESYFDSRIASYFFYIFLQFRTCANALPNKVTV
jgi:hypothetical protein